MSEQNIDPFTVHRLPQRASDRPVSRPLRFIVTAMHPSICVASLAMAQLH